MPFDKDGNYYPPGGWNTPEKVVQEKKAADAARFDSSGKVVLPSEKDVQYTRPSDTAKYDPEREKLGVKSPISMETLQGLYDNYKSGKVSYDSLSFDTQQLLSTYIIKNLSLPDIYVNLTTIERNQFDSNKDGVISKQEFQTYNEAKSAEVQKTREIALIEKKQDQKELILTQNTKHDFLHFDATILISIGFLCITAIVITLIISRSRTKS